MLGQEPLIFVTHVLVVLIGIAACFITGRHAYRMFRYRKGIGQVLFWMLFGELLAMGVTMFFAASALFGLWDLLGPLTFSGMRIVTFVVPACTTINLMLYLEHRLHLLELEQENQK